MDGIAIQLLILVGGLIAGAVIAKVLIKGSNKKVLEEAEKQAKNIIKEAGINAENTKKEKIIEAKEKYLKMKSEFEEEVNRKKNQILANENKVKQRDSHLSKQIEKNKRIEAELEVSASNGAGKNC
jgi:ribonuclease Y